jgi:glycosyltransferase involved in cell wall biosynthesis
MKGVSVVVCCYNSSARLPKTLEYLAKQETSEEVQWEIVLVDNNSSDNTADTANYIWSKSGHPTNLNVVQEKRPGLSFARQKGIEESRYDVIVFCDDDNWLQRNYIETVFNKFNKNSELGALGGWCEPVFEENKPEWFDVFAGNFAVGKSVKTSGFLANDNSYIYGAGLAIHKKTLKELDRKGFKNILTDRKGTSLSSGGDVELIYAIKLIGHRVYFDENLFFYHFMPLGRMHWDYLLRLRKSMYWSNFVLGIYRDALQNEKFDFKSILKKAKQAYLYVRKNKKKLKDMSSYDALLLKNQIQTRKLYLRKILFYISTRNKIEELKNA